MNRSTRSLIQPLVAAAVLAWRVVARITRAVDGGPQGNAA